jgi:hypothetical protein
MKERDERESIRGDTDSMRMNPDRDHQDDVVPGRLSDSRLFSSVEEEAFLEMATLSDVLCGFTLTLLRMNREILKEAEKQILTNTVRVK